MLKNVVKPLIVVGGVALDITATVSNVKQLSAILNTSTPGIARQTVGGVGRNICEAAMRNGAPALMLSIVGDDLAAKSVLQGMTNLGMDTKYVQTKPGHSTAVYNALHAGDGQLVAAVADMAIFDHLQPQEVSDILHACDPGFVCFDGNIPSKVMLSVANTCRSLGVSAFFEPTSVPKSLKLFEDPEIILSGSVRFTSPNQYELEAMTDMAKTVLPTVKDTASALCPKDAPSLAHRVLPQALYLSNYIPNILLKLGEHGCLYVAKWRDAPIIQYFSPEKIAASDIKSVNGAGDTFVGTLAASLYRHPLLEPTNTDMWRSMITRAQKAAVLTLQSELAVSPKISEMAR